jgi:hypothetical protein
MKLGSDLVSVRSQVNAVVYVGDGRSREVIRAFEFPGAPSNRSRSYGFEAIITTYELVLKVGTQLQLLLGCTCGCHNIQRRLEK